VVYSNYGNFTNKEFLMKYLPTKIIALFSMLLSVTNVYATRHVLYYVPPASNDLQQAFIRVTNPNTTTINFSIDAIDDSGTWSSTSSQTLSLLGNSAIQLSSVDIESGNSSKGLLEGFGSGEGSWRLVINSDSAIDVMSYVRTPDGFLNDMHDVVGMKPFQTNYIVPIFNPASNPDQQSKLRISNDSDQLNSVTIYGYDDKGKVHGSVLVVLKPLEVVELTSTDLESGNSNKGLTGKLGDGSGKWRLEVFSSQSSTALNLLELPGGYISNLSGKSDNDESDTVAVIPDPTHYVSYVKGTFNGWDGDTIVELDNGQFWKQSGFYFQYLFAFHPEVVVYENLGVWQMWVAGISKPVSVTLIN
jgi:hypothetical protein